MKKLVRILSLALVSVMALTLLVACGGVSSKSEKIVKSYYKGDVGPLVDAMYDKELDTVCTMMGKKDGKELTEWMNEMLAKEIDKIELKKVSAGEEKSVSDEKLALLKVAVPDVTEAKEIPVTVTALIDGKEETDEVKLIWLKIDSSWYLCGTDFFG